MKQEKYFCDKCEKEVGESKDLFTIIIEVNSSISMHNSYSDLSKKLELCKKCAQKLGILKKLPEKNKKEAAASIEDRLYEIVEELVSDAMNNQ